MNPRCSAAAACSAYNVHCCNPTSHMQRQATAVIAGLCVVCKEDSNLFNARANLKNLSCSLVVIRSMRHWQDVLLTEKLQSS